MSAGITATRPGGRNRAQRRCRIPPPFPFRSSVRDLRQAARTPSSRPGNVHVASHRAAGAPSPLPLPRRPTGEVGVLARQHAGLWTDVHHGFSSVAAGFTAMGGRFDQLDAAIAELRSGA